MNNTGPSHTLSREEAISVLRLRLLLARAANKDGLDWWDDESLTPHAGFVLERIFPIAPALASRSLALRAATARHQVACADSPKALHLYRLDADNQDGLAVRSVPLLSIPVPQEPIPTMDSLRRHLRAILGGPAPYSVLRRTDTRALQIEVSPVPRGLSPLLHRARALAWAYLEGAPGEPVFPYCVEGVG